ncbi:MAG: S8 family serine peptidase, partial [Cytophagales bacterium]|nr:S8 family serine peptidase [Cytophagales bacterium]
MRINFRNLAQSVCLAASMATAAWAQSGDAQTKAPENWFNLDPQADKVYGVSTERAYQELLKGRKATPVIVAVIDGGVDVNHEDLKPVIWVNEKEIPNNGKDDDKNGYVDDIYGWNFIGGKDSSVHYDNLEVTRLYRAMKPKFDKADPSKLSDAEKKEYEKFQKVKAEFEKESKEAQNNYFTYQMFGSALENVKKQINKNPITLADLQAYKPADPVGEQVKQILENAMSQGATVAEIESQLKEGIEYFEKKAKYHMNLDFDPRATVGDDYANARERNYGNNDV